MQNFGKIKNIFNSLLIDGIIKKDDTSKKIFKKYLKTIRESKILTTQFLIYNNIEKRIENDPVSANLFISENLKLLEKFTPSDIEKENKKLVDIIGSEINCGEYPENKLHESITNLIFTKRTPKNIDKITEDIKNVSNYIISNKEKVINETIDMPISFLMNIMVEKYNTKYSELSNDDKIVLKTLINSDFEEKVNLYKKFISECNSLVDKLLINADGESKEKLSKVKERLSETNELNESNLINKISKIIELKDSLRVFA